MTEKHPQQGHSGKIDADTDGGKDNHIGMFTKPTIFVASFVVGTILFGKVFTKDQSDDTANGGQRGKD